MCRLWRWISGRSTCEWLLLGLIFFFTVVITLYFVLHGDLAVESPVLLPDTSLDFFVASWVTCGLLVELASVARDDEPLRRNSRVAIRKF